MLCGPKASAGTRLSEEEQRTSAEEESPAEEPEDDVEAEADRVMREEAEREPTAEEEREASAEEFTRQALDILREQYPGRTEEKYMDQWTGGFGLKDKIWKGANVVHVIAHQADAFDELSGDTCVNDEEGTSNAIKPAYGVRSMVNAIWMALNGT